MSEEIKLKPCPFCGGEPEINEVNAGEEPDVNFTVSCSCTVEIGWCKKEKAIKAWNARTQPNELEDAVKEIESMIIYCEVNISEARNGFAKSANEHWKSMLSKILNIIKEAPNDK